MLRPPRANDVIGNAGFGGWDATPANNYDDNSGDGALGGNDSNQRITIGAGTGDPGTHRVDNYIRIGSGQCAVAYNLNFIDTGNWPDNDDTISIKLVGWMGSTPDEESLATLECKIKTQPSGGNPGLMTVTLTTNVETTGVTLDDWPWTNAAGTAGHYFQPVLLVDMEQQTVRFSVNPNEYSIGTMVADAEKNNAGHMQNTLPYIGFPSVARLEYSIADDSTERRVRMYDRVIGGAPYVLLSDSWGPHLHDGLYYPQQTTEDKHGLALIQGGFDGRGIASGTHSLTTIESGQTERNAALIAAGYDHAIVMIGTNDLNAGSETEAALKTAFDEVLADLADLDHVAVCTVQPAGIACNVPGADMWAASGSGTDEYYLKKPTGASTHFLADKPVGGTERVAVAIGGTEATEGTVGSLAAGEWDWGDNDSLGYSTLYVRLADGSDPDDLTSAGHIATDQAMTSAVSTLRANLNEHIRDAVCMYPRMAVVELDQYLGVQGGESFAPYMSTDGVHPDTRGGQLSLAEAVVAATAVGGITPAGL
jgi:hypothetical protein